jgi:hypothetical protein
MLHLQKSLFLYVPVPSDIIPEVLAPLDCTQHLPEQFILAVGAPAPSDDASYRPDGHLCTFVSSHGPPAGPVKPVTQVQLVIAKLKAGEAAPNGQFTQIDATEFEYVSAGQSKPAVDIICVQTKQIRLNRHVMPRLLLSFILPGSINIYLSNQRLRK